jgi:predicted translin family RNA/ssDNA-binding protein
LNDTSNDDHALSHRAATEAKKKLAEIHNVLKGIAHELVGPRFWRYTQNISGGLQEYIEALSFVYYIEYGRLVSYERVQATLRDDTGQHVGRGLPAMLRDHPNSSTALSATVV